MLPLLLGTLLAASCPVSPVDRPASAVIGAAIGKHPAWMVDGGDGRWSGADRLIKTLFVFSSRASGSLRITGRRPDGGDGELLFQDGSQGTRQPSLEMADPWRRSVTPGGSTPEILRAYAFIPSYVIYPSRGCWELTVRLGAEETRITIELR